MYYLSFNQLLIIFTLDPVYFGLKIYSIVCYIFVPLAFVFYFFIISSFWRICASFNDKNASNDLLFGLQVEARAYHIFKNHLLVKTTINF